MEEQKNFTIELETEVSYSCNGVKTRPWSSVSPEEEVTTVEDIYVGVIIKGKSIDITSLLDATQMEHIDALCFEHALIRDEQEE